MIRKKKKSTLDKKPIDFLLLRISQNGKRFPNYLSLGVELKTSSSPGTVFLFSFQFAFFKYLKCFNLIFILHWSIFDLQCCIAFMCIAKQFSFTYTHSFSSCLPIYFITEYWVEFSMLYSGPLLIVYFTCSDPYLLIPNS